MELTAFGKYVRKLRIDAGMRLKDMAEACGVSSSFLSSMEVGRREITDSVVEAICSLMNLNDLEKKELNEAKEQSRTSFKVTINSTNDDDLSRALAGAFARNFSSIDDAKKKEILKILAK